jgi:hypothetical protein
LRPNRVISIIRCEIVLKTIKRGVRDIEHQHADEGEQDARVSALAPTTRQRPIFSDFESTAAFATTG